MKAYFALLALIALTGAASGSISANYTCGYADCIEGLSAGFNVTFTASEAEFADEKDWNPISVIYNNTEVTYNGEAIGALSGFVNLTKAAPAGYLAGEIEMPLPENGVASLQICYNKSVYGDLYSMSTGTASGSNAGKTYSRATFLFGWSKYTKVLNRTCKDLIDVPVKAQSEIGCLDDSRCAGDETCKGYQCEKLSCGEGCVLATNHTCTALSCCAQDDCYGAEECIDGACVQLSCTESQMANNHTCSEVACGLFEKRDGKICVGNQLPLIILFVIIVLVAAYFLVPRMGDLRGLRAPQKPRLTTKSPIRKKKWYKQ